MTSENNTNDGRATAHAHPHLHDIFSLGRFSAQSQTQKHARRKQTAPAKYPVHNRHLDEFTSRESLVHPPGPARAPTAAPDAAPRTFKEPLSIKPMRLLNFVSDDVALYVSNILHPSQIPGRDLLSRVYAMAVLPILIIVLTVVQGAIGLLVIVVNHTGHGARYYDLFFKDQIALFDETDFVDPEGNDEAVRQLAEREPRVSTYFSYHIANLLLIMSSMAYQRDDKLVAEASKILLNVQSQTQQDKAAKLLQESEREIDENSTREFGMRFMGISELKTLGGPFAGLFYNDDSIVLVFKGTSVLAFNEYLLDVTIQRVDASEYLYGEVHKGFYESLFPDAKPLNCYEDMTYDQNNPFNTIMATIFETARISKHKTGKPVNLWLTGHSLGGALAALVMARLQMIVEDTDPLMNKDYVETDKPTNTQGTRGPRTVLDVMLARFSDDPDLLVLRDCYSIASPKVGDSTFAEEFGRNELRFALQSPYRTAYWRIVADKDVVPRLPPGCSVDPNEPCDRIFPCRYCTTKKSWLIDEKQEDGQAKAQNNKVAAQNQPPKHLHSLLDYQHVGQLVKVYNAPKVPQVQPSAFEADLSGYVLRDKAEMQGLFKQLSKVATSWKAQDQIHGSINGNKKTTTVATSEEQSQAATAEQITNDIAKAQALYDVDELSRLRQPRLIESLLLTIPSLLSHAPATYQRNLVRGRFHFQSFPGAAFEKRVGEWLDKTEMQNVEVDEGVEIASSDSEQESERTHAGKKTDVDATSNGQVKAETTVKPFQREQ
ncbi:hypothetical protein BGZ58_010069 [Dissophora ornata]|nr:hypothetical protein BGZ58_010069 [Dissophora ornata]